MVKNYKKNEENESIFWLEGGKKGQVKKDCMVLTRAIGLSPLSEGYSSRSSQQMFLSVQSEQVKTGVEGMGTCVGVRIAIKHLHPLFHCCLSPLQHRFTLSTLQQLHLCLFQSLLHFFTINALSYYLHFTSYQSILLFISLNLFINFLFSFPLYFLIINFNFVE